jgi:hypothetical protein
MRLVEGSEKSVEVQWFFTEPGALPGPYTRLASGNWSSWEGWPWVGVGEVKGAPRKYTKGENPYGLDGKKRCITDHQAIHGLPAWPTPGEWHWCCTPYVSDCRIGIQDPPRSVNELAFAGLTPIATISAAFPSRARIAISAASIAPFSAAVYYSEPAPIQPPGPRPIKPGFVSKPAISIDPPHVKSTWLTDQVPVTPAFAGSSPANLAEVYLSDVVISIRPRLGVPTFPRATSPSTSMAVYRSCAVVWVKAGFSSSVVSISSSGETPYPVTENLREGAACVCVSARSISGLITPLMGGGNYSGVGSSIAIGATSGASMFFHEHYSHACVCVTAASIAGLISPPLQLAVAAHGYGSYPSTIGKAAYCSRACVCVSPASKESFDALTGTSSVAGGSSPSTFVLYVSHACVCVLPSDRESFNPFPGSGTSSGGGGAGPDLPCVPTACGFCTPTTLYATFTGSLASYGTVVLTNNGTGSWISGILPACSGGTSLIVLACFGNQWSLAGVAIISSSVAFNADADNPFFATTTGTGFTPGCPGPWGVTIVSQSNL